RKTNSIVERSTPFVVAKIGLGRDELIDQVALGPHDLHAVVARALRKRRALDEARDRSPNAPAGERAWLERRDRGAHRRRRHREWMIGVAAGVEDLQGDPSASRVHGVRHDAMALELPAE